MKKILILVCIVAICYSCEQKPTAEKITSLNCGEKTTLTDQDFCDKFLNAEAVDSITFGEKEYRIERKGALIKGITGSIDYCMSDGEKGFEVAIISNESSMNPLSAIVERTH